MENVIEQIVKALGWSMLHSLWQGAIAYALLFLTFISLPKIDAKYKHNIALFSLTSIFITFIATFCIVFELPKPSHSVQSFNIDLNLFNQITTVADWRSKTESFFPIASIVYFIGLLLQFLILANSYLKLKKLKKEQTFTVSPLWQQTFGKILDDLKINKNVQFFLSSKINVPVVIGFFKPVILFPFAMAGNLEINQLEAILIHELSHIRRNDYLINLLKTFIETILFFNPFIWLTSKLIEIEREHACDDLVIKATGTPLTYAHTLLMLEVLKNKQTPTLSLATTGKNQHLYQRIKRITNMKTNYINIKQHVLILTLVIATVVSLAWIKPSKKQKQTASSAAKEIIDKITFKADTDSVKIIRKNQQKGKSVVFNKKATTYNSAKQMRDNMAKLTEMSNLSKDSLALIAQKVKKEMNVILEAYNSPEFKEKIERLAEEYNSPKYLAEMEKQYTSKAFKAQMEQMAKMYNSKQVKSQLKKQQEMTKSITADAIKAQMDQMTSIYNSAEIKNQLAQIKLKKEELNRQFNGKYNQLQSSETNKNAEDWNKKMKQLKEQGEELKKLYLSPEYKKLNDQYEKDLEKLKQEKGIKIGNTTFSLNGDKSLEAVIKTDFGPSTTVKYYNFYE